MYIFGFSEVKVIILKLNVLEVYIVSFVDGAVARHHAIAGKLIAELQTQTININMTARLSVILAGYVIGSVIAQYLYKI